MFITNIHALFTCGERKICSTIEKFQNIMNMIVAQFVYVIPGLPTREYFGNKVLWSQLDWLIDRDTHQVVNDPKYADDISLIRTDETKMNQVKRLLLPQTRN